MGLVRPTLRGAALAETVCVLLGGLFCHDDRLDYPQS